jgi:hypothetical protein
LVFIIPSYTSSCLALAFRCHSQSGPICFVFFGVLFCANSSIHINCWSTPAAWNRILSIFTENSDGLDSFSCPQSLTSFCFSSVSSLEWRHFICRAGLLNFKSFLLLFVLNFFSKGLAKFIFDRIHLILTYEIFCVELHIILYMYNLMSYVICTDSSCTHTCICTMNVQDAYVQISFS